MTTSVPVIGVFHDVTGKPFNGDRAAVRLLNRMMTEGECLVVTLPIDRLNATQYNVNDDFREAARRRLGDSCDLPAVVKYRGKYYVTDGHHRLMGVAADGRPGASVRLFDLDGDTQLDFPLLDHIWHSDNVALEPSDDTPSFGM